MDGRRERPSSAEVETWVVEVRTKVLRHVSERPRWRRLSRSLAVGSVAGVVSVGGLSYAAIERSRAAEPPPTVRDQSVIAIGRPAIGDKWLNVTVSYRCRPGGTFRLVQGNEALVSIDCDRQSFRTPDGTLDNGPGGVQKSVPVGRVDATSLSVRSTLSSSAVVTAAFSSSAMMSGPQTLPPAGADGEPDWVLPTYPVNEFGLTVGIIRDDVPEWAYPDLIPVTFRGQEVYLLKRQFVLRTPGTPGEQFPREAERSWRGQRIDRDGRLSQRVYRADGKTFVGWRDSGFTVSCSAC